MNKVLSLVIVSTAIAAKASAQVEDVSVIVAPTASYNWFDSKSTIENGLMYGLQAGFGFGRVVELRGIYERSADLKQNFGQYEGDIQNVVPGFSFLNRSVRVTRMGGEFKMNIPAKGFAPYLIIGTGVQKFERKYSDSLTYTNENLYGTAGLGLKINLGNRTTLNLEGRGLVYNMNPGSLLYNPGAATNFDDWINNQERTRMYNWSAQAGLQFYLGGRNEGNMSTLDKAYLNRFSGGMSGLKLTLAPVGAYMDFNSKSSLRTTYMLGGMLGVDLTNFVGLRAYYYQGTLGDNPSIDFDKMGMYGVDFVGNLNVARGIIPYITIGGGYIDVQDGYQGKNYGTTTLPFYRQSSSAYYAKGGLGLTVPLGKYVDAYGAANILYTVDSNRVSVTALSNTDQLKQHVMYNVGLRLKFGRNARTQQVLESSYNDRFAAERATYQRRLNGLEAELKEAYDSNDAEKVASIMQEKKDIEDKKIVLEQEAAQPMSSSSMTTNSTSAVIVAKPKDSLIRMTPAELQSMIDKTLKEVEDNETTNLEFKIDRLERLILELNNAKGSSSFINESVPMNNNNVAPQATTVEYGAANQRLAEEIAKLNLQVEQQNKEIAAMRERQEAVVEAVPSEMIVENHNGGSGNVEGAVLNKGLGIYGGLNVGDASTFNAGIRMHYGFTNSRLILMPELYVALGKTNGFGLSGNVVYPILLRNSPFTPYVGVGVGVHNMGKEFSFNPNVIAGTSYKLNSGNLFADYSVRGAFRNNQIALGYRFGF